MTAYECVQASRAKGRPTALGYIGAMTVSYTHLFGGMYEYQANQGTCPNRA